MGWIKYSDKVLKRDGAIAVDDSCCCGCDYACEDLRDSLGLPPLPSMFLFDYEYLGATCLGDATTCDMHLTTGVEWRTALDSTGCTVPISVSAELIGCEEGPESRWTFNVFFGGVPGQGYTKQVTVNCAAQSGDTFVEWTIFEDTANWACAFVPPPMETFRARVRLP